MRMKLKRFIHTYAGVGQEAGEHPLLLQKVWPKLLGVSCSFQTLNRPSAVNSEAKFRKTHTCLSADANKEHQSNHGKVLPPRTRVGRVEDLREVQEKMEATRTGPELGVQSNGDI